MPPKTWKDAERRVAELAGGTRQPITGRKGPDVKPDVPIFALEVKHGKQVPKAPWHFMEQAIQAVEEVNDPRVPAIAMHPRGMNYNDTLIAFRLCDFWKVIELARKYEGS